MSGCRFDCCLLSHCQTSSPVGQMIWQRTLSLAVGMTSGSGNGHSSQKVTGNTANPHATTKFPTPFRVQRCIIWPMCLLAGLGI